MVPRSKRGPEMLQDEVDRELLNESEVIEGVASALQRVVEQISEQIRWEGQTFKFTSDRGVATNTKTFCLSDWTDLLSTL